MTLNPLQGVKNAKTAAVLAEHMNAENTVANVTLGGSVDLYYDTIVDGAVVISQSITITKRCLIVVVAAFPIDKDFQVTEIQRDGVDKTTETTISTVDFVVVDEYGHLQYAVEILDAGVYTYNLVNTSGGNLYCNGSLMKIVAVSAT